jgi:hypothetical protein
MAKPTTATTTTTTPATATASPDALESAHAKLRELEADRAVLAAAIGAKQAAVATLADPVELGTAEIELAGLELKARALDNAIKAAKRKCETARLAADVDGAREAAKVATNAQQQLKVQSDTLARKLAELLKAQRELFGTIELLKEAGPRALRSAAATGQTPPQLHGANPLALARALVLEAREALGILQQHPNVLLCSRAASFPDAVLAVQHDMHQPTLHELAERLTTAQKLSALIDDSYPRLVKEVYAAREQQTASAIASSEALEKQRAAERKAERDAARNRGIEFPAGGLIV